MRSGTRHKRRPIQNQREVLAELRRRIVEGGAAPGSRLPTCRTIAAEMRVSAMTVQRALDHLGREGFIATQGARGTFVMERPPHLFRYGIVFRSDPNGGDDGYWPPAWHAMNQEALRIPHVDRRR